MGSTYSCTCVVYHSLLFYFIVCYYCKYRFKSYNSTAIDIMKESFITSKKFSILIKEHNSVCYDIFINNKFWKKYYFAINYTLIPFSLLCLHQLLFENLNLLAFLIIFIAFLCQFCFHLIFNLMTASINNEAKKSYKILIKILQKFNNIKILQKLMVCFIRKCNH